MRLRYKLPIDDNDGEQGATAPQTAGANHAVVFWQGEFCPACFSACGVCSVGLASGFHNRGIALSQFVEFQKQRVRSQVRQPQGGGIVYHISPGI